MLTTEFTREEIERVCSRDIIGTQLYTGYLCGTEAVDGAFWLQRAGDGKITAAIGVTVISVKFTAENYADFDELCAFLQSFEHRQSLLFETNAGYQKQRFKSGLFILHTTKFPYTIG